MTTDPIERARAPRRSLLWWAASAVLLAVGYADLWRGGVTIGPVCLVLAYGVAVPIAILRG